MPKKIFFLLFLFNNYYNIFAQPKIVSISPIKGYTASIINIYGSGFNNATGVSFGGISASYFVVLSPNHIEASPYYLGASGYVSVKTSNGSDSIGGFEFIPFPIISSMIPTTGEVGSEITIKGTNLPMEGKVLIGWEEMEILFRSDTLIKIKLLKPASGQLGFKLSDRNNNIGTDLFFNYAGFLDLKACPGKDIGIQVRANAPTNYQWQVSIDSGTTFNDISNGDLYKGVNTNFMIITRVDSNMYKYMYRCSIGNNEYLNGGIIKFYHHWNIYTNDLSWENPANWSCGSIPNYSTVVEIPSGSKVILSTNVTCKGLILGQGADLTIKPGFSVTIVD
jgi:hypothetical protein